ncbi:recombinase family protein [Agrobacterium tumefaciens]|uniref:recombinase family protein n=1 Tax=Agrobacterium tumefaciens TaxID=358 RepID=UPI001F1A6F3E|nr:recombinase family protein [Agrobacterium tumefaciens]WCJ65021.1 recombinase family protein [Agrobacterium tumefaciens]
MHALKRVVLDARYSTDQQNPASIDTQCDLGKEFVARQGWHLVDTFVDAAVSGSSFETRPGLQAALAASGLAPQSSAENCPVFTSVT